MCPNDVWWKCWRLKLFDLVWGAYRCVALCMCVCVWSHSVENICTKYLLCEFICSLALFLVDENGFICFTPSIFGPLNCPTEYITHRQQKAPLNAIAVKPQWKKPLIGTNDRYGCCQVAKSQLEAVSYVYVDMVIFSYQKGKIPVIIWIWFISLMLIFCWLILRICWLICCTLFEVRRKCVQTF